MRRIMQSGIGAADPQEQVQAHTRREVARSKLTFQERIVGTTIDFTVTAPGEIAAKAAAPVARIVRLPGAGYSPTPIATGFMVAPGLLMTNHHVFPRKEEAYQAAANFGYTQDERGVAAGTLFKIDADHFFFADPDLDFAVVGVSVQGLNGENLADVGFCRLISATGKILTGMPVNIIQHPNGGPRKFAVTNNRLLDILHQGFLHYETDTSQGSSGSPLFNSDWELIGIHHAGIPKMVGTEIITRDGQPFDGETNSDDDVEWIANEGARVSAVVKRLATETFSIPSQRSLVDTLLATTADPLGIPTTLEGLGIQKMKDSSMANAVFNISGPVTINVYPQGSSSNPAEIKALTSSIATASQFATEASQTFDPDYKARVGYVPDFLGKDIPLPSVTEDRTKEMYSVSEYSQFAASDRSVPAIDTNHLSDHEPIVLKYHHYSLAFNRVHNMCMWTASNVDYSDTARQDTRKRADLGGENWALDPRVPADLQLKDRDIYGPGKRIDRGHIVRREDNCWGAPGMETAFANADSYHWTNCTPQHEAFNQENPKDNYTKQALYTGVKGIWGEFESVVQRCSRRMNIDHLCRLNFDQGLGLSF
ncbi:MAG: DNA/RNA non-specific endonuclease [Hylemonella sp.]|nr:DNA/RNA non-specific endonuclease [Hylemonella sp.]